MSINLKEIQDNIGYYFDNQDLLQQAFVRKSYSEENGGQNNEVLEFIGDKALDTVVIREMMNRFGVITEDKEWQELKLRNPKYFQTKYDEGKFTNIKKMLVEKKALSKAMEDLGFHTQLIMGKGDCKNHVENQDSVKEDLFEAIVGAVTIDCDWDFNKITNVVNHMIDFRTFFANEDDEYNDNYVGLVQEWFQSRGYGLPDYKYCEFNDGFECELYVIGKDYFAGYGESHSKARMECAKKAYDWLLSNGEISTKYEDAVGYPDEEQAIRQMNELVQKGLVTGLEYNYESEYDYYGNLIWNCRCDVNESKYYTTGESSSKKEAKRQATYSMLRDLMKSDEQDTDTYYNDLLIR